MSENMKAAEIKRLILEKKAMRQEPVEEIEILSIKGWLFKSTSYQMESWREACNDKDANIRKLGPAKLVQISFRDKDGNPVFEELDIAVIGGIEDADINRVFKRALAINGYGGEGIEAILKNLVAIVGVDGVYASLVNINAPCPNCSKDIQPTNLESNTSASNIGHQEKQQGPTKPSLQAVSQAKK